MDLSPASHPASYPMRYVDLGLLSYVEAWMEQRQWAECVERGELHGILLLVEHPPVLTLGRSAREEDLGRFREEWIADSVEIVETDRGGKITYHGPGQMVLYPIVNLRGIAVSLHEFIRKLEQTGMDFLSSYGVSAHQDSKHTGVWVGERKIAAIGIHVRRWITTHGMAININNTSDIFSRFIPCGISDRGVVSLRELLGQPVDMAEAKARMVRSFGKVFGMGMEG